MPRPGGNSIDGANHRQLEIHEALNEWVVVPLDDVTQILVTDIFQILSGTKAAAVPGQQQTPHRIRVMETFDDITCFSMHLGREAVE